MTPTPYLLRPVLWLVPLRPGLVLVAGGHGQRQRIVLAGFFALPLLIRLAAAAVASDTGVGMG